MAGSRRVRASEGQSEERAVARLLSRAVHDAILSEHELTKTRRGREAIADATMAYARHLVQLGINVSGLIVAAMILRGSATD